jgi:hypothetical protein
MTSRYVKLFGDDLKKDYDEYSLLDNIRKKQSRKKIVERTE